MERVAAEHPRATVRSRAGQRGTRVHRTRRDQGEREELVDDAVLPARADALRERRGDERADGVEVGEEGVIEI